MTKPAPRTAVEHHLTASRHTAEARAELGSGEPDDVALAQVHALLAVADRLAAIAITLGLHGSPTHHAAAEWESWHKAAGVDPYGGPHV